MTGSAPRGWRHDPGLETDAAELYRATTGQTLDAEVWLSPRMAGHTAGVFQGGPPPRIALSQAYLERCTLEERRDLMLHELAHYHLWRLGRRRAGHGAEFRTLMRTWRFSRYPNAEILQNLRRPDTVPRILYVCPAGHEHWLRPRSNGREISCGLCSRRFDRRHLLRDTGIQRIPGQEAPHRSRS